MTLRMLVAEHHPLFRDELRTVLSTLDVELMGEAGSGDEVVEQAAALLPDAILMDLDMPPTSGIEATERILARKPWDQGAGPDDVR